ncbi:hypothetical protein POVWA2_059840 [Plasmodium ovale wallikeri]|uniref:Uncharacterized protein n=1 Tax=Plasmodium ovale wallikeri TaxID=864142 RepID=A0A1A9A0H6_PLAOA|nr:hypothetical protein POVWA1_060460 [Plasmodium ovale wallikeri]SBT50325.1 hypothetical protein POVWA2_059840 [Plasmodium ovale wallikeri]
MSYNLISPVAVPTGNATTAARTHIQSTYTTPTALTMFDRVSPFFPYCNGMGAITGKNNCTQGVYPLHV